VLASVRLTAVERRRYVRWWLEESGLSRTELALIASSLWGAPVARIVALLEGAEPASAPGEEGKGGTITGSAG
jgi:hypothetical protein